MTKTADQVNLTRVLRRASDVLSGTRRNLAGALLAYAERIEKLRAEAKERCGDIHRLGCACVVLAAIDEPEAP